MHYRIGLSAAAGARSSGSDSGDPVYNAAAVIARLEEAGRTLLALPSRGYSPGLRTNAAMLLRHMTEAERGEADSTRLRPAVPPAPDISRMDEAFAWITLIPREHCVLRRVVGARSLVSPVTDRHLYPWRRLGTLLGADHKAVQRWHAQGIDFIVAALSDRGAERFCNCDASGRRTGTAPRRRPQPGGAPR
jgi:hypothetical protein